MLTPSFRQTLLGRFAASGLILLAFSTVASSNVFAQRQTQMRISVNFDGASDARKKAIEKHAANALEFRGIHKISDNGLDPKSALFDDSCNIVISSVGDRERLAYGSQAYALETRLSIVQGISVNNMLVRFSGSLSSAVVVKSPGNGSEGSASLDQLLFSVLDRLMDEAKRDFGSPAYRQGWYPMPMPHPAQD